MKLLQEFRFQIKEKYYKILQGIMYEVTEHTQHREVQDAYIHLSSQHNQYLDSTALLRLS